MRAIEAASVICLTCLALCARLIVTKRKASTAIYGVRITAITAVSSISLRGVTSLMPSIFHYRAHADWPERLNTLRDFQFRDQSWALPSLPQQFSSCGTLGIDNSPGKPCHHLCWSNAGRSLAAVVFTFTNPFSDQVTV